MSYSKGIISIPNVTGNIVINVTTEEAEIRPIELYTGNAANYLLNKKYSDMSIIDANGYYLTNPIAVDFSTRPYLCINGANIASGGAPKIYKIGFYNGDNIATVCYTTSIQTSGSGTQWSANVGDIPGYQNYTKVQFMFSISPDVSLTEANVLTAASMSIKASPTALY